MTKDEKPRVTASLKTWASGHPEITRVVVYGSRARGEHRPDSDLDVAVEIEESRWQESPFTIWLISRAAWQRELEPELPWPLDLQWHDPGGETPTATAKIQRGHFVVYERGRLSPTK